MFDPDPIIYDDLEEKNKKNITFFCVSDNKNLLYNESEETISQKNIGGVKMHEIDLLGLACWAFIFVIIVGMLGFMSLFSVYNSLSNQRQEIWKSKKDPCGTYELKLQEVPQKKNNSTNG